jgi:hypothetical protein
LAASWRSNSEKSKQRGLVRYGSRCAYPRRRSQIDIEQLFPQLIGEESGSAMIPGHKSRYEKLRPLLFLRMIGNAGFSPPILKLP